MTFELLHVYIMFAYDTRLTYLRECVTIYTIYNSTTPNNNNIPVYVLTLQLYSNKLDINVC